MRRPLLPVIHAIALAIVTCHPASAQTAGGPKDAPHLTVSGYFQPQYERTDTGTSTPRDRVFFRRMVLSFHAVTSKAWAGTIIFDLAPSISGDKIVVKDANLQYLGWRDRGLTFTIGNQKPPFSRSLLTSSARRQIVERTFAGDRSLGSLGRAIGVKVDGTNRHHTFTWSGELASSLHAPDASQIRVDGLTEAGTDWNEGVLVVGRVEWHPRGEVPREQGDIQGSGWKFSTALAAYAWHNDGDSNLYTDHGLSTSSSRADASDVRAIEVSGGVRGHRLSIDAEFEHVTSHALDTRFSGGLYEAGLAVVSKAGVEAGCMLVPRRLEVVGSADVASAGTYDRPWRRVATGLSWYVDGHDLKFQVMQRLSRDDRGVDHARSSATYVQAQFAF